MTCDPRSHMALVSSLFALIGESSREGFYKYLSPFSTWGTQEPSSVGRRSGVKRERDRTPPPENHDRDVGHTAHGWSWRCFAKLIGVMASKVGTPQRRRVPRERKLPSNVRTPSWGIVGTNFSWPFVVSMCVCRSSTSSVHHLDCRRRLRLGLDSGFVRKRNATTYIFLFPQAAPARPEVVKA